MAPFSRCWCCPRIPWGVPWCSPSQKAPGWTEPRQPLHHWCELTHSCRWWVGGRSDLRPGPKQTSITNLSQLQTVRVLLQYTEWIRTYRVFSLDILNEGQTSAAWSILNACSSQENVPNLCCWSNQARVPISSLMFELTFFTACVKSPLKLDFRSY